jgi:dephospho-CoA kinase
MQRSQMPQEDIERIMQTQASREARLAAADWVVSNETDQMEDLRAQAQALYQHLSPAKP